MIALITGHLNASGLTTSLTRCGAHQTFWSWLVDHTLHDIFFWALVAALVVASVMVMRATKRRRSAAWATSILARGAPAGHGLAPTETSPYAPEVGRGPDEPDWE